MNIIKTSRTFVRYSGLFKQLVSRDVKLRYRRSVLGYLWSILNPLLVMMVLTIVFSNFFSHNIHNYPIYYLSGQIVFNFFTGATSGSTHSIIHNASLIKKIYIPKYVFVISTVTTSVIVDFVFSLGALVIVMLATQSPFSLYNLLFVIPMLEVYMFTLGLGLFLAQANVFFRDIQYIWRALTTAWMYFTPLFYPEDVLPENMHTIVTHYNPMYMYVRQMRDFIYDNTFTDPHLILRGFVIAAVTLLVGILFFKKNQDKFILYI